MKDNRIIDDAIEFIGGPDEAPLVEAEAIGIHEGPIDNIVDVTFEEGIDEKTPLVDESEINIVPGRILHPDEETISDMKDETSGKMSDSEASVLKALQLKATLKQLAELKDSIKMMKVNAVPDMEMGNEMSAALKDVSLEQISAMTPDQIDHFFDTNGFNLTDDTVNFGDRNPEDEKDMIDFKKSLLTFYKEMDLAEAEHQEKMLEFNKEIEELEAELGDLLNDYQSVSDFMDQKFEKIIEESKSKVTTDEQKLIIDNYEAGLTLQPLIDYLKSSRGRSVLGDFLMEKQTIYIYKKFLRCAQKMNFNVDLTKFYGLERYAIGDDAPANRYNITLFTLFHYVAKMFDKMSEPEQKALSVFLRRLHINIVKLVRDEFVKEEESTTFCDAIKTIVDVVD